MQKTTKLQKKYYYKNKEHWFDLDQLRGKESTVFENKMIDVVYNSLRISSKPGRLMLP